MMTVARHTCANPTRWSLLCALALVSLILVVAVSGCAPEVTKAIPRFVYDPDVAAEPPERPQLVLQDDDRILVLAPHPDDEVINTGGLIQQAVLKDLPVRVVFLTNGDNNEFAFLFFSKAFTLDPKSAVYAGTTRAFEALRAGRELGLMGNEESFLGYPDFGTLEIWLNRWDDAEAYRGMFSEQDRVPYWFARTPDNPYKGESVLKDITQLLAEFEPTKVFVSHPADTNPDHAALYLFLRTALWELEDDIQPNVYAFLTHYGEWPQPRGLLYDAPHEPPAKLDEPGRWVVLPLEDDQPGMKLEAIKRHKTQFQASKIYLESYMRSNELFDRMQDIVLSPEAPQAVILPSGSVAGSGGQAPEWQDDGVTRTVSWDGDELVFSFELAEPASKAAAAELQVMGYRGDRPFAEMPKVSVELQGSSYKIRERGQRLSDVAITASTSTTIGQLRIPMDLLDNPHRVIFKLDVGPGKAPPASTPWLVVNLIQQ